VSKSPSSHLGIKKEEKRKKKEKIGVIYNVLTTCTSASSFLLRSTVAAVLNTLHGGVKLDGNGGKCNKPPNLCVLLFSFFFLLLFWWNGISQIGARRVCIGTNIAAIRVHYQSSESI